MNESVVDTQIKYAQLTPTIVMKMKSVTLSSTFLSAQGVVSVISGLHSRNRRQYVKSGITELSYDVIHTLTNRSRSITSE